MNFVLIKENVYKFHSFNHSNLTILTITLTTCFGKNAHYISTSCFFTIFLTKNLTTFIIYHHYLMLSFSLKLLYNFSFHSPPIPVLVFHIMEQRHTFPIFLSIELEVDNDLVIENMSWVRNWCLVKEQSQLITFFIWSAAYHLLCLCQAECKIIFD